MSALTYGDVIDEIDQLQALVDDVFGETSETMAACEKLIAIARREAQHFSENEWQTDELAEYEAAHACGRIMDARALKGS